MYRAFVATAPAAALAITAARAATAEPASSDLVSSTSRWMTRTSDGLCQVEQERALLNADRETLRLECVALDDREARLRAREAAVAQREALAVARGAATAVKDDLGLVDLEGRVAAFAAERDWDQFHTPRNILLALCGEVGELAECFQWKGEVARGLPGFSEAEKAHVGEELADVLIYTVRLAHVCGIRLDECVPRKMVRNAQKYPADKARGRADKYTAYMEMKNAPKE